MIQEIGTPEIRLGGKLIAHLPKGQIGTLENIDNKLIRITFADGRVIDIPLHQEN